MLHTASLFEGRYQNIIYIYIYSYLKVLCKVLGNVHVVDPQSRQKKIFRGGQQSPVEFVKNDRNARIRFGNTTLF